MTATGVCPLGARTAVVIATHAYCFPLEKCLSDFSVLVDDPRDVILVDNGSGGAITEWVKEVAPAITTLTREINGFFCGGYNEGLQYTLDKGYEYALIVNADTDVCNLEMLHQLIDAANRHPRAAFIGPKVYFRDVGNVQNTVLTYPSFWRNLKAFLRYKLIGARPAASDHIEKEVDFLNGVCVLCRVEALKEFGLLDETMGGYVEDTDWAWRAKVKGWNSLYTPVESIVHHQPDVGYEHYSLKSFMLRRNTIFWHHKCGRRIEAWLYGRSARCVAWLRCNVARLRSRPDIEEFEKFSARLAAVDRAIRANQPVSEWFGPPVGDW